MGDLKAEDGSAWVRSTKAADGLHFGMAYHARGHDQGKDHVIRNALKKLPKATDGELPRKRFICHARLVAQRAPVGAGALMNARIRWNRTKTVALVQNLDEAGQPWLGTIRHEELLGQYVATSAQYEAPRELGMFGTPEEAVRAVELDAESIEGRRAYAAQVVEERRERRERRARALARAA
jgi:hypothetical protein